MINYYKFLKISKKSEQKFLKNIPMKILKNVLILKKCVDFGVEK